MTGQRQQEEHDQRRLAAAANEHVDEGERHTRLALLALDGWIAPDALRVMVSRGRESSQNRLTL